MLSPARASRLYTNADPVGVELAAALKNVIAIGAGVCNGLGLGNNTIAALITRGLAEITRLAVAAGGNPKTLAGLAGLGDLVLTSTGALSRNRQVGIELGQGRGLAEIVGSMRMVAEGIQTTYAAVDLAARRGIEMPITGQVRCDSTSGALPARGHSRADGPFPEAGMRALSNHPGTLRAGRTECSASRTRRRVPRTEVS